MKSRRLAIPAFAGPAALLLVISLSGATSPSSASADTSGRSSGSSGGDSTGGLGHRGGNSGGTGGGQHSNNSGGGGGLGHRGNGGDSGGGNSQSSQSGQGSGGSGDLGHRDGGGNDNSSGSSNSTQYYGGWNNGNRGGGSNPITSYVPPFQNSAPTQNQWSPKQGQSRYSGNNNLYGRQGQRPVSIQSVPTYSHPVNSLPTLVLRQSNVTVRSPYRTGYYGYGYYPGWNDSYFFYSNYVFSPFGNTCVISPWYYYSMLPGYIAPIGCTYFATPFFNVWPGTVYYWNQGSDWANNLGAPYGDQNQESVSNLDVALSDIQKMFVQHNIQNLVSVTNPDLSIPIFIDGKYQYSLNGQDFYGLMRDNIMSVNTVRYTILDVRRNGYQARVLASQEFYDAWGQYQRVYQQFIVDFGGSQAIITQFGTSHSRPW